MVIDLSALKVLLVDDEPFALKLMQMILREIGVNQIFTANNGLDALKFLGECEDLVNLVICDWNMPRMDGVTLLQQIRSADPDLLFMMVTGRATIDSVRTARAYGVFAYIAKPFSPQQLEEKLIAMSRQLKASGRLAAH